MLRQADRKCFHTPGLKGVSREMDEERRPHIVPSYSTSAAIYNHVVGCFAFEHWRENLDRLERGYGFDLSRVADAVRGRA